jgi:hypothetical protein
MGCREGALGGGRSRHGDSNLNQCHCEVIPRWCLFRAASPRSRQMVAFHIANHNSILVKANTSQAGFRSTTYQNVFSSLCHTTPCMHACPHLSARRAGCVIQGKNSRPRQAEAPQEGCEAGSVIEQTRTSRDTCTGCPVAEVAPSARVQVQVRLCVVCVG